VVSNCADFPQRIVISGSASLVVPGVVGKSFEVSGKRWTLGIEHQPFGKGAWRPNAFTNTGQLAGDNGRPVTTLHSKDVHWPGDDNPDDLVLMLERLDGPPAFQVAGSPSAVDDDLRPVRGGFSAARARYLAVSIANAGGGPFGCDAAVDISAAGRAALGRQGVHVLAWTPDSERATRQEVFGSAVSLPPLSPGQRVTVYFPVEGSPAGGGSADVEFEMRRAGKPGAQRQTVHVPITPQAAHAPRSTSTGQALRGSAWTPALQRGNHMTDSPQSQPG
jgi:hypothetical protein